MLGVHPVVLQPLRPDRGEGPRADVQRYARDLGPSPPSLPEDFFGEVEPRCGSRRRAGVARVDCLVSPLRLLRSFDVRWQGHPPAPLHRPSQVVPRHHPASFAEALDDLEFVPADGERHPRLQTLARADERLPGTAQVAQQEQLDLSAARSAGEKPRREDLVSFRTRASPGPRKRGRSRKTWWVILPVLASTTMRREASRGSAGRWAIRDSRQRVV